MITNPQNPSGLGSSPLANPILSEIDNAHASLSPDAQDAIGRAHGLLGIQPPSSGAAITSATASAPAAPAETSRPEMAGGGIKAPVMGLPGAPDAATGQPEQPLPLRGIAAPQLSPHIRTAHQQNLDRLTATPLPSDDPNAHTRLDTGRSGIDQIHSPFGRVPLQILDAVGRGFFPGFEMALPGTQGHHDVLVNQAGKAVNQEEAEATDETKRHLQEAQAAEQESLPELHRTQAELAGTKATNAREIADAKLNLANETEGRRKSEGELRADASLRQHGFKKDEHGAIVPLSYEEMSQDQQAIHDLKSSQSELADARRAYEEAKTKNAPALMDMARRRIDNANHTASIAERRLGLSEKVYDARYLGTDTSGAGLPGALISDDQRPVGSSFSANVRPTGQERNKAGLAASAREQIDTMRSIISQRPDVFGPLAGRKTDLTVWLGSQDPDAQRFIAARTLAADHAAGVFGGRSEEALKELNAALGHFKDNPKAALAGLEAFDKANKLFEEKGTVRTTGSNAAHAHATSGEAGATVNMKAPDGTVHPVPSGQVDHYKKLGAVPVP